MKKIIACVFTCAVLLGNEAALAKKPAVGVAEFHNTASGTYWWGGGVGWELSGMLTNELANIKLDGP